MAEFPVIISPMTAEMLPACAEIAQSAPDPWTLAGLEANLKNLSCWNYVALHEGAPMGFACFLTVTGNADLQQLVVSPSARRNGVAKTLLDHAFCELANFDIKHCLLEVRCQNTAAVGLYTSLGFKTLARRAGMFQNPPDDGFLMAKMLDGS